MRDRSTIEVADEIGRLLSSDLTCAPLESRTVPVYSALMRAMEVDPGSPAVLCQALKQVSESLGFTEVRTTTNEESKGEGNPFLVAEFYCTSESPDPSLELKVQMTIPVANETGEEVAVMLNDTDQKLFAGLDEALYFVAQVVGYIQYTVNE